MGANFLPRVPVVQTRTIRYPRGMRRRARVFHRRVRPRTTRPVSRGVIAASAVDSRRRGRVAVVARRSRDRPACSGIAYLLGRSGTGGAKVSYDRGRRSRLHHFEGAFASAGGVELRSPVRTTAGPEDDGAWRVGGRYQIPPLSLAGFWMTGFDVGIGVEGSGEHLSFDCHYEPAIELQTGLTNLGTAAVIAARLQRWSRWSVVAAWGNGLTLGRSTARHRGETETTLSVWGGGWQTNLEIEARCVSHRWRACTPPGSTAARAAPPPTTRSPSAGRDSRWG